MGREPIREASVHAKLVRLDSVHGMTTVAIAPPSLHTLSTAIFTYLEQQYVQFRTLLANMKRHPCHAAMVGTRSVSTSSSNRPAKTLPSCIYFLAYVCMHAHYEFVHVVRPYANTVPCNSLSPSLFLTLSLSLSLSLGCRKFPRVTVPDTTTPRR